jgi:hypothetical protein
MQMSVETDQGGSNAQKRFVTVALQLSRREQLMRALRLIFAVLWLSPMSIFGATLSLSAEPGKYNAKTLGPHTVRTMITATIQLTGFRGIKAWPAGAYVGFHEGEDRNNSIQFVLMRNTDTDPQLATGYRILHDGKEFAVRFIKWAPLEAYTKVELSFDNGLVVLRVGNSDPIKIKTLLRKVAPYASVSSGSANFVISP